MTGAHIKTTLLWLFLLALSAPVQGSEPPRCYSIHDTDGDGYLSREEYLVLLELRRSCQKRRGGLNA